MQAETGIGTAALWENPGRSDFSYLSENAVPPRLGFNLQFKRRGRGGRIKMFNG